MKILLSVASLALLPAVLLADFTYIEGPIVNILAEKPAAMSVALADLDMMYMRGRKEIEEKGTRSQVEWYDESAGRHLLHYASGRDVNAHLDQVALAGVEKNIRETVEFVLAEKATRDQVRKEVDEMGAYIEMLAQTVQKDLLTSSVLLVDSNVGYSLGLGRGYGDAPWRPNRGVTAEQEARIREHILALNDECLSRALQRLRDPGIGSDMFAWVARRKQLADSRPRTLRRCATGTSGDLPSFGKPRVRESGCRALLLISSVSFTKNQSSEGFHSVVFPHPATPLS